MGQLINLAGLRRRRAAQAAARHAALATYARMHPGLRWQVGADDGAAHRRTPMARAVCGAVGTLRLADPTTPLCPACYPDQPHGEATG